MGRKIMRKRRRVFSLEPNKLVDIMFTRNYIKNLLTSLAKINCNNKKKIASNDHQWKKTIRFEVDMAMALSASGFAWGHAMKEKLQRGPSNYSISSMDTKEDGSALSSQEYFNDMERKKCNIMRRESLKESEEEEEEVEEEKMENGLKNLRMILPGGGDGVMDMADLLKQTASYIKCLELQVKVLGCLVHDIK